MLPICIEGNIIDSDLMRSDDREDDMMTLNEDGMDTADIASVPTSRLVPFMLYEEMMPYTSGNITKRNIYNRILSEN
jgi:hypothetical protein